ncbi:peptide deformylase [Candidatus Falkowbacteria bacterium CG10_big_fil_rev_8_21_14_0_10_37_14]|uniref:Peptide deformylase n=1 Tax=Candidatus Falkowbacteria bacterium CG10_big_fil_rev_8_21_14_0_10_37_14 TaxID=1974561 RepID=A0A2M6WSN1_9BACT|nr:peptide deformylase [Candidatus Falkowbacteria bacterium]PIT95809.1 MAG: peptide deformylase [Candidatus Falkowbacteria bacterium CG10_big_fil_rev_8_21_14_0_10_37_14]
MSILKIITHPNPLLRQISLPFSVAEITNTKTQQFITDMIETMLAKDGVGLAAPQVGQSRRMVVVNTKQGPLAMFNPEITKKSLLKEWDEEGCLSIPQTFGRVKRPKSIRCQFIDATGKQKNIAAQGLLARVIQHEADHLDGKLFIDFAKDIVEGVNTL